MELKYLIRVDPDVTSRWSDWRSWTQDKYFDNIASDLARWSRGVTETDYDDLGCDYHALLLVTFWGPERDSGPLGAILPEEKAIAAALGNCRGPRLDSFESWGRQDGQDCERDPAAVRGHEGCDVYVRCDLVGRQVE
jgi:hypothetical protein